MAGSVNKVILVGRVGKDPEVRSFDNGGKLASFTMATSERWRDKSSGEMKEITHWHQVVLKNDALIDGVLSYIKKGSFVYIEGQLQTRKYTDKDGNDRYVTEVVLGPYKSTLTMLDNASDRDDGGSRRRDEDSRSSSKPDTRRRPSDDLNDDIPF